MNFVREPRYAPTEPESGQMNPDKFLAEVTRIVVETAKDLWRREPLTNEELATITDRILLLAERKEKAHEPI